MPSWRIVRKLDSPFYSVIIENTITEDPAFYRALFAYRVAPRSLVALFHDMLGHLRSREPPHHLTGSIGTMVRIKRYSSCTTNPERCDNNALDAAIDRYLAFDRRCTSANN